MSSFEQELAAQLTRLREDGLYRELRRLDSPQGARVTVDGRELRNFSSNDYLGLANHPALKEAATRAVEQFGAGAGASRLICGSQSPAHQLEEVLAIFKGTEAALSFSTGYAAALGTIPALVGKDDIVIIDKLVHACCVDAAKLSGAKLRVFAHNDLADLERILQWADSRVAGSTAARRPRILIITESVFSMDGDLAPLRNLADLKDRYGAWLMVDEAHATGLFGEHRSGLAEAMEQSERIEIQMGTLGKSVGASGGYIAGKRVLMDLLINRARSFIFSTAPVPAAAAAACAGIELIQSEEGEHRRTRLWALVEQAKTTLLNGPWSLSAVRSAILPLMVGPEAQAMELAATLRDQGFLIPAIRYPTVARGKARLRLTLTADHTLEDLTALRSAVEALPKLA